MTLTFANKNPSNEVKHALCQACYHMVCGVYQLNGRYKYTPKDFYGALTNGCQWIFLCLTSTSRIPSFGRSIVINIIETTESSSVINRTQVELLTKYLMISLLKTQELLESNNIVFNKPTVTNTLSVSSLKPTSKSGSSRTPSTSTSKASGQKSSSSAYGRTTFGKTSSRVMTIDTLTDENIFIHNLQNRMMNTR